MADNIYSRSHPGTFPLDRFRRCSILCFNSNPKHCLAASICEFDQPDAIQEGPGQALGSFDRQASFTNSANSSQRNQARIRALQYLLDLRNLTQRSTALSWTLKLLVSKLAKNYNI